MTESSRDKTKLLDTSGLSSLSILMVDDNEHMCTIVSEILNSLGVTEFRTASGAKEALATLESFAPDVIITDWEMTPMNGLELVRRLRDGSNAINPAIPIIMMTAHTSLALVEDARDAGVDEILAKPVSPKTLHDRLLSLVRNPRPFITDESYLGPDRRRQELGDPGAERRRRKP